MCCLFALQGRPGEPGKLGPEGLQVRPLRDPVPASSGKVQTPWGCPRCPETCSFWPKRCRCPSTFPAANGCNRVFTGEDGRDWGDRIAWLPSKCPSLVLSFINSFSLKFLYFGSCFRRKNLECLTLTGLPFHSFYCSISKDACHCYEA